ncbi:hypothetical protein M3557_16080, partial [Bhargavaea ginsengi]
VMVVVGSGLSKPPAMVSAQKRKCRHGWRHHVWDMQKETGRLGQARHQQCTIGEAGRVSIAPV